MDTIEYLIGRIPGETFANIMRLHLITQALINIKLRDCGSRLQIAKGL